MKKIHVCLLLPLLWLGCSRSPGGELLFVEPNENDRFQYPYFLFLPEQVPTDEKVWVVIQPNNSGRVDDDLQKHLESAKRTASVDFYLGNYVARALQYPLLVPVFPRPETEWQIYTHSLDRDVMLQKNNSLERIDLQLIHMFEDAQSRLEKRNIKTQNQFLMTGFSASGTFANRFTLLHPDKVFAVAAGGVCGLLMLPMDSLDGEALAYPLGVGDVKEWTQKEFQKELFLQTPQFYFMGSLDTNDAVAFDDAYAPGEREQIYRLLGKQMQPERWEQCQKIYLDSQVNALMKTYKGVGHKHTEEIKNEIVEFFKEQIRPD
jgi:hypothetical protein